MSKSEVPWYNRNLSRRAMVILHWVSVVLMAGLLLGFGWRHAFVWVIAGVWLAGAIKVTRLARHQREKGGEG